MVGNTNSHLCFSLFTFGIILLQVNEAVAPEASFDLPIENVTATEGATAILPCSVKFLGRHQVVWLDSWSTLLTFNDRRIINDQRISIERPFVSDWNLHIRNVGHNDQGTYECQVNTVPEKKKVVNLKVQGAPILLFANRKDIRETVPGGISKVIVPDLNNAVAVDFIFSERIIFWTDVTTDRIMRAYFDDYQNTTVVIDKGILSPVGLACDWLNMKLYWISSETNQIEVSNLDGTFRKVLFWDELDQPRAIALDPANGYIYWTDWGIHPKIEKAGMDGNKFTRSIIIEENIHWPNGLAIDYDESKLYWTDAKLGYIHGCDFDGSNRREVVTESLPHPFGITVYDKMLYWTDWKTGGIHGCDKLTGTQRAVVLEGNYSPMDIKAFIADKQSKGVNPCGENNGGCSHLCLLSPKKPFYACACPTGVKLQSNNKTCEEDAIETSTIMTTTATYSEHTTKDPIDVWPPPEPEFLNVPYNITVREGELAKLPCSILHLGAKQVVWKKIDQYHLISIGTLMWIKDRNIQIEHIEKSEEVSDWNMLIRNVKPKHSGTYECQVMTPGKLRRRVYLNVYGPPITEPGPPITEPDITIVGKEFVEMGDGIRLVCNATGGAYIPEELDWFKDGDKINHRKYNKIIITKYRSLQDRSMVSELIIDRSTLEDSGTYICRSSSYTIDSIKVTVLFVPPKIIDKLSSDDVTAREGDTVTLVCNVTGTPMPTVTWHHQKHLMKRGENETIGGNGETLLIRNISRNHGGLYECKASNGISPAVNRIIRVTVEFAPEIIIPYKRISQRLGRDTILECTVSANPPGVYRWTKNGRQLLDGTKYRIERYEDEPLVATLSLQIWNLRKEDFGTYSCEAENYIGKSTSDANLFMNPDSRLPQVEDTLRTVTVMEGSTAILPCSIRHLGPYRVSWTDKWSKVVAFQDRRVLDDDRFMVERPTANDWNLLIRNVKRTDAGIYTCHVNTNPVTNKTVTLKVQVPTYITAHSDDKSIRVGENVDLVCNVTGEPTPTVAWYKLNNVGDRMTKSLMNRGQVLHIVNSTRESAGLYECVASNNVSQPQSRKMKINVEYAPQIRLPNKRIGQQIGRQTILECVISAYPQSISRWKKDGQVLLTGEKYRVELYDEGRWNITLSLYIKQLEKDDFGKYTCEAINSIGGSMAVMTLYEIDTVKLDVANTTVEVTEGSRVILSCSVRHRRFHKVFWTDQQSEILTRGKRILTKDKRLRLLRPTPEEWNLLITKVKQSDQGQYKCSVNTSPPIFKTVTLEVQVIIQPQKFTLEPQDTTAVQGSTVVLKCTVANKMGIVQWTKDGFGLGVEKDLPEFPRYQMISLAGSEDNGDYHLQIVDVQLEDSAEYQCTASPTEQVKEIRSRTARLNVKAVHTPQEFLSEPEDTDVIVGESALLQCEVANKTGRVLWTKNSFVLGVERNLPGFPRYQIISSLQMEDSENSEKHHLRIVDVQLEDDGEYECEVTATEHVSGIRSRTAHLNVILPPERPRIEGGQTRLSVVAGQPYNISCRANNSKPAAEITWYMNNQALTGMIRYRIIEHPIDKLEDSVSTITVNVSKSDDGKQIECRAQNKAMVEAYSVKATLHIKPMTAGLKEDIAATLRCRRNPGLAVTVVKDGKVVLAEGFGQADVNKDTPVTNRTLFGVASLSKAFASSLLLKLISRRNDLSLQTKVVDILGEDFGFPDEFRTKYTTLEDILSHRTGLPSHNAIRFDTNLTRENLPRRIKHLNATGTWRGSYMYSNLMYGVVTRIAEVLGGASWEELVQRELYDPLQMTSSNFATKLDWTSDQVAKPYRIKDGEIVPVSVDFSKRWALLCGSGCVVTNALDAANWMKFHLSKGLGPSGERVMEEEDINQLYVPRTAMPDFYLKYFNKPDVPVTSAFFMYALGWRVGYYRGYKMIVHSGSTYGYRALLTLLPTENLGIFIALTGDDPNYEYRFSLQNYIADTILGEKPWLDVSTICSFPEPWFKPSVSPSMFNVSKTLSRDHEEYEGIYHNMAYGNLEIYYNSTHGQLMAKYGFARFLLYRLKGDTLFGEGFGINDVKHCSSLTFKKTNDSKKFVAVEVAGFEKKSPPIFTRNQT